MLASILATDEPNGKHLPADFNEVIWGTLAFIVLMGLLYKFAWPAIHDGVMRLSRAQFEALFEGLDWRRVHAPRVRRPAAAE